MSDVDSNDAHDAYAATKLQAYKIVKCKDVISERDSEIKNNVSNTETCKKNDKFKFELNMLE